VLGTTVSPGVPQADEFGDPYKSKLTMQRGGQTVVLEEASLGGGALAGLLRFKNTDLVDAGNLLGRMALALGTVLNQQHSLGLDQTGAPGRQSVDAGPDTRPGCPPLPTPAAPASRSRSRPRRPATGDRAGRIRLRDGSPAPRAGSVRRVLDGRRPPSAAVPVLIDGLTLQVAGAPAAGDRFMITPYRQVAAVWTWPFASPRNTGRGQPGRASAGVANQGTLTLQTCCRNSAGPNLTQTVTLTFTGAGSFDVTGTGTGNPTGVAYTPGQPISYNGWALTLKGSPKVGDTYTVQANAYPAIDAGNAHAMLAIRDLALFDGAATTDGYAGLMSEIGVRVQSAGFSQRISESIAPMRGPTAASGWRQPGRGSRQAAAVPAGLPGLGQDPAGVADHVRLHDPEPGPLMRKPITGRQAHAHRNRQHLRQRAGAAVQAPERPVTQQEQLSTGQRVNRPATTRSPPRRPSAP
jgi:flagellar hook-associated protein 1 FlgK